MKACLIISAACVLAVTFAMVPRERRALPEEQTTTEKAPIICEAQTPCGWYFYKEGTDFLDDKGNVTNSYCKCAEGTRCVRSEELSNLNVEVLRCRPYEEGAPEDSES